MEALAAHATFQTDFTFNESMLRAMSRSLPDEDRPIVAKLRSITVHSYRFAAPGLYDAAALDAVRTQLGSEGWKHLVTKQAAAHAAAPVSSDVVPRDPMRTDVWIRTAGSNVDGAVVLVANQKNIDLVYVDGVISPLDLLHLRGHFGIPRFPGDGLGDAR